MIPQIKIEFGGADGISCVERRPTVVVKAPLTKEMADNTKMSGLLMITMAAEATRWFSSTRSINRTDAIGLLTLALVTESALFAGNKGVEHSVFYRHQPPVNVDSVGGSIVTVG